MLEDIFGWKEGQGLGATNQGAPEPLPIIRKNDRKGIAFVKAKVELLEEIKSSF